jgi:hypothetical protein
MIPAGAAHAQSRPLFPSLFSNSPPPGPAQQPSLNLATPDPNVPRPPALIGNQPPEAAPAPAPLPPPAVSRSPIQLVPPAAAAPSPAAPNLMPAAMGGLALSARFGRDASPITSGLHWRVFGDRPEPSGQFRAIKEDKGAAPNFVLPPGTYVVHVAVGLASAAKRVQIGTETVRETFDLPVGALRFDGRVGDTRIPNGQVSFEIYRGSQFEPGEKRPIASELPPGELVVLPEGAYHVVSAYGDGNAVMRHDVRVQAGKLTDARISHRAAVITLKLVGERGGEALANTAWSVLTPGGDVIKESIGAFPVVILAEGDYVALARNEGKVFNREFKVEPGIDREIELLAR